VTVARADLPPDPRRARIHAAVDALLDALLDGPAPSTAPPLAPAPAAPLCDKREIARALSVSVATVDRLDREGQPHVRIGDAKRYDLAAVLAWHRERSERPETAPTLPPANETNGSPGVRRLSRARAGGPR
jgi:hypothetical protein